MPAVEAGTTINHISWLRLGFKQYGGVTCEYFSNKILGNMQCLNDPVQQLVLELKKKVKMNMNMLRNNMHYGTPDLCNPSCLQQRKPRSDERQVQDKTPSRPLNYIPHHPPLPPALACSSQHSSPRPTVDDRKTSQTCKPSKESSSPTHTIV